MIKIVLRYLLAFIFAGHHDNFAWRLYITIKRVFEIDYHRANVLTQKSLVYYYENVDSFGFYLNFICLFQH